VDSIHPLKETAVSKSIKELGKYLGERVYYDGKTGAVGLQRLGSGIYILDWLCFSDDEVGITFPKFRVVPDECSDFPESTTYAFWECHLKSVRPLNWRERLGY